MEKAMKVFGIAATIFEIGAMFCRAFSKSFAFIKQMRDRKA